MTAQTETSSSNSRSWFALYTASNHEKRVAQYLQWKNIETFVPLYGLTKKRKNRVTVKLELPLFANYVFARIAAEDRVKVLEAPMVYSIVGKKNEAASISDSEIDILQTRLRERQVHPFPYLTSGQRVRIRSGNLAGLEGVVVRTYGQLSVVLSVEMIQRSVAVHVEAEELEPCNPIVSLGEACA